MKNLLNDIISLCFPFENYQEKVYRVFLVLTNLKKEIEHDLLKEKGIL